MTSIPVAICRSSDNNLKRLYLKKETLFVFTRDVKYFLRNMQIFWQQLPTPLSRFFIAFLKCAWNLEHFEKKENCPSLIITEIIASERDVYLSVLWIFYISEMCMKFRTLKGLASAHHSVINVLTGSKHCWSQHGTNIFLFFHEFDINWVEKCLP